MEWYEIIGIVIVWFLGIYLGMKYKEFRKNSGFNDSWKDRNTKL
jgi:hypothetical protein